MNKQMKRTRRSLKTKLRIKMSSIHRIVVFRSSKHLYAQIVAISDGGDKVIVSSSTVDKELKNKLDNKNKIEQAVLVGKMLAERALKKGLEKVAFDRAGYKYHGRVKALADSAREAGLQF